MMSASRSARGATPRGLASGRRARSTRAARPSTGWARGRGSGGAGRIRANINQAPTRKWAEVLRPPAPGVKFLIPTWVPIEQLTEEERETCLPPQFTEAGSTVSTTDQVPDTSAPATPGHGASTSEPRTPMAIDTAGTSQSQSTLQVSQPTTPAADSSTVPFHAQDDAASSAPPAKRVKLDTDFQATGNPEAKEADMTSVPPPPQPQVAGETATASDPVTTASGSMSTVQFDMSHTESTELPPHEKEEAKI